MKTNIFSTVCKHWCFFIIMLLYWNKTLQEIEGQMNLLYLCQEECLLGEK